MSREHSSIPVAEASTAGKSLTPEAVERQQDEDTIRTSQADYRAIFDTANDAIFIHDIATGKILDVNQRMSDLYGYTREEAQQLSIEDVSSGEPPYSQTEAVQWIKKATEGQPQLFEWLAKDKGGRRFWVEVILKLVTLGGNDRMLAVARDITDRKRIEDALQRSEARYRAIIEDQSELICRFLPDGTLTFVNEAYCRYFGKKREELIGHSCMPFIPQEDREWVRKQFASLSPENPVATYEHRVIMTNQETRWLQWSDRALFDKRGTLVEFQSVARDITDRKQTTEALWESEEKYRSFMHNFHGIAFQGDLLFVPDFFQGAVEEITGYTENDFTAGKPRWDQVIHPDDLTRIRESVEKICSVPGYSTEREYRIIRKNGEIRWVHEFIRNTYDDYGKPVRVQGAIYDITDRRQTEEALRENEFFLDGVFESIQDGISVLDTDLTIHRVNGIMKQWYAENLPLEGKKCHACYHNKNMPCNPCPTLRCIQSGRTERDIVPGLSGSPVEWIELFSYPIKDRDSGEVRGVVEFVRDITDRKRAEEALRESEERFRQIAENAGEGFFLSDASDNRAIYVSPAYEQIWGRSLEIAYAHAQSWLEVVHPEDRERVNAYIEKHDRGKVAFNQEYRILWPDGSIRWVRDRVYPIKNESGEIYRIVGVTEDITERKQIEETLRKSEEQYRSIFNSVTDCLFIFDMEGRIVEANTAACQTYGYSYEELIGLSGKDIVHPDYHHLFEDFKQQVKAGGRFHALSVDVHKDGSTFDVEVRGTTFNFKGELHFLAVTRDITERKRAAKTRQGD